MPTIAPGMSPNRLWLQAAAFARRGWTAVTFLRRGYGRSQGGWAENYGSCGSPDYTSAGRTAAADLAAVARYMLGQAYVAKDKWISVGVSAGGFATIALTAEAPPGLAAAIAFAPGRGSRNADEVCGEKQLVAAFAAFGKTSRTPLLWVSAPNDHFFGPRLVSNMTAAFSEGGGQLTFVAAPPFGDDGHQLFSCRERHADLDADRRSLSGRQQAGVARPPDRHHDVGRRGAAVARATTAAQRSRAISKAVPTRPSPSRARITAGYPAAARPTRRSRMRSASVRNRHRALCAVAYVNDKPAAK